ncbi:hypothetical protein DERF_002009 [Dermatophagoides farinae]|uniref:Uncharacterized protein n=1 Tax=Dermatophagoides farinae TaxID=6954 RepID=A0A922IBK8_DERFA|nr:hypothetical protein DERF_002009 [Dermatophagoides farinae]
MKIMNHFILETYNNEMMNIKQYFYCPHFDLMSCPCNDESFVSSSSLRNSGRIEEKKYQNEKKGWSIFLIEKRMKLFAIVIV